MNHRCAAALLALSLTVAGTHAAELVTLATMAVTGALDPLAQEFERQNGQRVKIAYDTGPNLARRVAGGEQADVLIAPDAVVGQAAKDGRVIESSRVLIGRVGVGVAVRQGARMPDIRTADQLKAALLAADAVYYSQGTSGAHVASVFATLGVADQIRAKTMQMPNGGVVMERVIADRRNALGFTMLSEIQLMAPKGARLVGPLPGNLQNFTPYAAAVMTGSSDVAAARAFLAFITTPAGTARFRATGWQP